MGIKKQKKIFFILSMFLLVSKDSWGETKTTEPDHLERTVSTTRAPGQPPEHRWVEESSTLPIEVSYPYLMKNPKPNAIPLKIRITDPKVLAEKNNLFVTVSYRDQKHSKTLKKVNLPVSFDDKNNAFFELTELREGAVYGLSLSFFKGDLEKPKEASLLASHKEFNAVTSGTTDLAKARHKIATTALLEYYAWQQGKRGPNAYGYCSGGWCGMFPLWCTQPECKVFKENPLDSYQKWGKVLPVGNGLKAALKDQSIMGDHGWRDSHKFMFLEFDEDTQQFLTIEGNFNNRVGLNHRTPNDMSRYGKLTKEMLW